MEGRALLIVAVTISFTVFVLHALENRILHSIVPLHLTPGSVLKVRANNSSSHVTYKTYPQCLSPGPETQKERRPQCRYGITLPEATRGEAGSLPQLHCLEKQNI